MVPAVRRPPTKDHLELKWPFSAQRSGRCDIGAPISDVTPSPESLKAYLVGLKVVLGLNAERALRTALVGRELR